MTEEFLNSIAILMQLVGAIVVVLLVWAFFNGLYEERSFKGALNFVKEMLKDIPAVLVGLAIAFCVLCLIGMFLG